MLFMNFTQKYLIFEVITLDIEGSILTNIQNFFIIVMIIIFIVTKSFIYVVIYWVFNFRFCK